MIAQVHFISSPNKTLCNVNTEGAAAALLADTSDCLQAAWRCGEITILLATGSGCRFARKVVLSHYRFIVTESCLVRLQSRKVVLSHYLQEPGMICDWLLLFCTVSISVLSIISTPVSSLSMLFVERLDRCLTSHLFQCNGLGGILLCRGLMLQTRKLERLRNQEVNIH